MISIATVKRDFAKLSSVKREINVKFAVNRDFQYVFVIFDNRYDVTNDIAWFSVTFGQPSFVYFDQNGGSASTRCPK